MIFTMNADEEMTDEKLKEFIESHTMKKERYTKLHNLYIGKHDILNQEDKDKGKPDNRLVVNFVKYIVDTLNGYFVGHPIKTVHDDKTVADKMKRIAKRNSQNDNNAELSKMCSIFGHAYEILYQDDEAQTRVTYLDPRESFVIYDDTISQAPLYGVRIIYGEDGRASGTLYSKGEQREFKQDKEGIVFEESEDHFYGDVPIIEYLENEERQSVFEPVITLINAYNKAISEKANDVDYFADAYLSILGVELDEETIQTIRDNRIINLKDGDLDRITVQFLDKPNADTTQENLINRLEDQIYQKAMVANISDDTFGTTSGISLKFKLQSMENVALMKERKFTAGMMQRFKMMFNIPTNFGVDKESYLDIDYIFTRNIPNNNLEEAETASKLAGIASRRTQLSALSMVDNVQDELDELDKEKNEGEINSLRDMNTPLRAVANEQE